MELAGDLAVVPAHTSAGQAFETASEDLNVLLGVDLVRAVAGDLGTPVREDAEMRPAFKLRDPLVERVVLALGAELETDGLGGPLYAEALARVLAVQLLRGSAPARADAPTGHRPRGLSARQLQLVVEPIEDDLAPGLSLAEMASLVI